MEDRAMFFFNIHNYTKLPHTSNVDEATTFEMDILNNAANLLN